ncbi:MAG: enoyl-CoA hydratase/isomerase family protein [Dehalococcoidia bacterium]
MSNDRVLTDIRDGVFTATINRPARLNAADRATAAALRDALHTAREDDAVRAVVITGVGRGWCSGADLARDEDQPVMTRNVRQTPLYEYAQVTLLIDAMDKPVIAAVNGMAAGAGRSWATACDRRIAAESARFAAIFVRRGLCPDAGISYFLPRLVGMSTATHLLMTGEIIDAKQALAIRLADEVVPDDALAERAHAYAAALAQGASIAVDLARRAARRSFERTLESSLEYETWSQSVVGSTEDRLEGVKSFLEKREPRFKGQ